MAETLVLTISPKAYAQLRERAERLGKSAEELSAEIIEAQLALEQRPVERLREILEKQGLVQPRTSTGEWDSPNDAELEEIRAAWGALNGPSLSDIVIEQRGPQP